MSLSMVPRILVILLLLISCVTFGKTKSKTRAIGKPKKASTSLKKGTKKRPSEKPIQVVSPPLPVENLRVFSEVPKRSTFQINPFFGIHVVKGSALLSGLQIGHRVSETSSLFLGVEYNFSLYSPGSILGFLGGGWYEFPLEGKKGPSLSLGVVAGSGFTTDVIATPTTVFMGYFDLVFAQPMDDLFDLRIQLRPGYMYKYLAFMMNLSIAFRLA